MQGLTMARRRGLPRLRRSGAAAASVFVMAGALLALPSLPASPAGAAPTAGDAVTSSAAAAAATTTTPTTTAPAPATSESEPMQYDWLKLDQPGADLAPNGWTVTGPATGPNDCGNLQPPQNETATATLTSGQGGAAQFGLTWGPSGQVVLAGPVVEVDPGALQLNLQFSDEGLVDQTTLSGYGPSFSGPATVSAQAGGCTWTGTVSLTLDGAGLTCAGSSPPGTAAPATQAAAPEAPRTPAGSSAFSLFSGPPCPLFIKVTQAGTGAQSPFNMKSGVSYLPGTSHPVAFTSDAGGDPTGSPFTGQCMSGCTDLIATVGLGQQLNEPGQPVDIANPVDGATVTAKLVGLSSQDEIVNPKAGMGTLCAVAAPTIFSPRGGTKCGTEVTTVTGEGGAVPLRYWGPASWQNSDASPPEAFIQFQAVAHDCRSSACVVQRTGSPVNVTVAIDPHVIFDKSAVLTTPEFGALVQWVSAHGISSGIQALSSELSKLKVFDDLRIVKALKGASKTLHMAEQASDVVLFELFEKKFGVVSDGLDNYDFQQAEAWLLALIKNPILSATANYLETAVFGPNNVFDDQFKGTLKKFAQSLARTEGEKKITHLITVKIYEASFCLDFDCPPGLPPDPVASGPGVHYNLYFAFSSTDKAARGTDTFFDSFIVDTGYAAPTWVATQCAPRGGCADHP